MGNNNNIKKINRVDNISSPYKINDFKNGQDFENKNIGYIVHDEKVYLIKYNRNTMTRFFDRIKQAKKNHKSQKEAYRTLLWDHTKGLLREKQVMENTVVDLNDCVFISNEDKLKHPEYFI